MGAEHRFCTHLFGGVRIDQPVRAIPLHRGTRNHPSGLGIPDAFSSFSYLCILLPPATFGLNSTSMATIPDLTLDTGMPANVEAEKTILGAILLDNTAHSEAAEKLDSEDFSLDSHRRIFLRMTELMNEQRAVDIVTLSHELARYKEVEAVGGVAYLASLTEGLPRRPVIEEYIRIVKDKSLLRKLMGICSMAIARAADQS